MSKTQSFAPLWIVAGCMLLFACGGDSSTRSLADSTPTTPVRPPSDNLPPQISGTPQPLTLSGSNWRFQPSASDPDGDALQFFVENAPAWTTFNPATGRLEGTPGEADVGAFSDIRISVTDGLATVSLPTFVVEVQPNGGFAGTATLSWTPPTERVDGSPIGALAGYRVLYSQVPGDYDRVH